MTTLQYTDLSLEDFLAQAGQPDAYAEGTDGFVITNDDEALWAVRRLAQAQRRIDEVKRQAQIELDRINSWVEANSASSEGTIAYFEKLLSDYLISVRENEADGRKSLDFPDGKVSSRVTPSKVSVTDVESFITWAEANGHSDWVRVKREADVSAIKKVADYNGENVIDPLTGETVAGLAHIEGGISVTVKVVE